MKRLRRQLGRVGRARLALGLALVLAVSATVAALAIDGDGDQRTVAAYPTGPAVVPAPELDVGTGATSTDPSSADPSPTTTVRERSARQSASTTTSTVAAGVTTTSPPATESGPTDSLLVADHGSLVRVDPATGALGQPIPVGIFPTVIVVSPDKATAYVAGYEQAVVPVTLASDTPQPAIDPGFPGITAMALTPDGRTLFVTGDQGQVARIDLVTRSASPPVKVGRYATGVAVLPDGGTAYVASNPDGSEVGHLTPFDVATNSAGTRTTVKAWLTDVVVSPDGGTVFLGTASGWCNAGRRVIPVAVPEGRVESEIALDSGVSNLASAPGGRTLYVSSNPCIDAPVVALVDAVERRVTRQLRVPGPPGAAAVAADERFLYLASRTDLHVIHIASGQVVRTVGARSSFDAVAVIPPA